MARFEQTRVKGETKICVAHPVSEAQVIFSNGQVLAPSPALILPLSHAGSAFI